MAISIINNGPNGAFTPSSVIQWDSNNGPPFPPGWRWWIDLTPLPLPGIAAWQIQLPFLTTGDQVRLLAETRGTQQVGTSSLVDDGQTDLAITLRNEANTAIDSQHIVAQWDARSGLGVQAQILAGGQAQGGFTAEDRTDLQLTTSNTSTMDTNWQQYEQVTLPSLNDVLSGIKDSVTATVGLGLEAIGVPISALMSFTSPADLLETNLTGGPTCDNVIVNIGLQVIYGLEVNITNYPDDWVFSTPDHQWGHHDLAVLQLVSGDVILARHGIHTLTHTWRPLPTYPLPWLWSVPTALTPFGLEARLYFAAGVCGELIAQHLP